MKPTDPMVYAWYRLSGLARQRRIKQLGAREYAQRKRSWAGRPLLSAEAVNQAIGRRLRSGKPFLAARLGATELLNLRLRDFPVEGRKRREAGFRQLCRWSGFFPEDSSLLPDFAETFKAAIPRVDLLGVWFQPFEEYYIRTLLGPQAECAYLLDLEPWSAPECPWTAALEGRRVLVIHPFARTIREQYARREALFPGTKILPAFSLRLVPAVQTLAGNRDERFADWFEALDWMFDRAMEEEFDTAIIGCGAYGLPLAAKIRQAGRQAIHLGGAVQLLFGIRGRRWDEGEAFGYVRRFYNDCWVWPPPRDRVRNGGAVEGGCYWGREPP